MQPKQQNFASRIKPGKMGLGVLPDGMALKVTKK